MCKLWLQVKACWSAHSALHALSLLLGCSTYAPYQARAEMLALHDQYNKMSNVHVGQVRVKHGRHLSEEFLLQLEGPALVSLGAHCQVTNVSTLQHHLHDCCLSGSYVVVIWCVQLQPSNCKLSACLNQAQRLNQVRHPGGALLV